MSKRSLSNLASFIRDIGSSCSKVRIIDGVLIAGSINGKLNGWATSTGELLWSVEIDGIIADFDFENDTIYTTGPNKLFAFSTNTEKILWSEELEGGGDFVRIINEEIWVTSSVYDIEVFDFIEATTQRFSKSGKLLEKWIINERPWFLGATQGDVILGLGRPRCGGVRVLPGEMSEHFLLSSNQPVTSGANSIDRIYFGHSDGTVSTIDCKSLKINDTAHPSDSLVTSIISSENGWISGHEDGTICFDNMDFHFDGKIDSIANFDGNCWASFSNNGKTNLVIIDSAQSQTFLAHENRVRFTHSADKGLALGDDSGKVLFFEIEVVKRRLAESNNSEKDEKKRGLLKDRLRQLRS
ncbi:MAG: hypothetical protein HN534_04370 [Euryarchaeota archaeon]|jgi:hypothetical protein|nr:hypothetical protein [Euryarchaeota archaeon]MBT3654145.1 hypothetical protein [Euryarchaeota archaeon]MBT3757061.1 hypothetical protein [Euryarchaeota archaeon]MBT4050229.1 hypothetical protein [Euryarchaeota archaeon]MBT4346272.1 hypothetical protein [Euryarchaeota archaeon]